MHYSSLNTTHVCKAVGLKSHINTYFTTNSLTFVGFMMSLLTVPSKVVPQSLAMFSGLLLLLIKLPNVFIKLSMLSPSTSSMWIALKLKHVNNAVHHLIFALPWFTRMVLNRSVLGVLVNGGFKAFGRIEKV